VHALEGNTGVDGGGIVVVTVGIRAGIATVGIIDRGKFTKIDVHRTRINRADVAILAVYIRIATTTDGVQRRRMPTYIGNAEVQVTCVRVVTRNVIVGFTAGALGKRLSGVGTLVNVAIAPFLTTELSIRTLLVDGVIGIGCHRTVTTEGIGLYVGTGTIGACVGRTDTAIIAMFVAQTHNTRIVGGVAVLAICALKGVFTTLIRDGIGPLAFSFVKSCRLAKRIGAQVAVLAIDVHNTVLGHT
jgi:hypothetical protein